jgi:chaperonin cofactor prefoldin
MTAAEERAAELERQAALARADVAQEDQAQIDALVKEAVQIEIDMRLDAAQREKAWLEDAKTSFKSFGDLLRKLDHEEAAEQVKREKPIVAAQLEEKKRELVSYFDGYYKVPAALRERLGMEAKDYVPAIRWRSGDFPPK